ncbi:MAG: TonB-dependent receptor, partial [Pseudomonadota bacterium]
SDIRDLDDFIDLVPNLTGERGESAGEGAAVRIRGIGRLGGTANTFGLYVDGFDVTGATSDLSGARLIAGEQIEVLRGPQGTAFGRNVVAGAISITSLTPNTEEFSGRISARAGNFNTFGIDARVNVPITDDVAALVSGYVDRSDGFVDNIGPIGGSNDTEDYGFRLGLAATPSDRLRLKASVSWERFQKGINGFVPDGSGDNLQPFVGFVRAGANPFVPPETLSSSLDSFFPDQTRRTALDFDERSETENLIATFRADYDLGASSLVWVSGYSRQSLQSQFDVDASELDNLFSVSEEVAQFYSSELRWQSNGDNKLDWIAGVFGYGSDNDNFATVTAGDLFRDITFVPPAVLGPFGAFFPSGFFALDVPPGAAFEIDDVESSGFGFAVFGDIDFQVTDRLNLLVGGRYNYDEVEQSVRNFLDVNPDPTFPIPNLVFVPIQFPDADGEFDSDAFTWRASLVYDVTNNVNAYATVSRGYRPGGLQLGAATLDAMSQPDTTQVTFDSEFITNYEAGFKANFFDRKLLLNVSAYFMDWDDIQFIVQDQVTGEPFTANAEAEAYGVEVDAVAEVSDWLTIYGGFAYNESEFTSLNNGDPDDPRIGRPLPYAPEITASVTTDMSYPVSSSFDAFLRTTFSHTGERTDQLDAIENQVILDAYNRLDFRFGLERVENWRLEGFVTNVLNEEYATAAARNPLFASGTQFLVAPPRQYGVRFTKDF